MRPHAYLLLCAALTSCQPEKQSAAGGTPAEVPGGEQLYVRHCAGCHGPAERAGAGSLGGPVLTGSHDAFVAAVRRGEGSRGPLSAGMPRFTPKQLPDGDLEAIYTFVQQAAAP